jgi:hypothetical protein
MWRQVILWRPLLYLSSTYVLGCLNCDIMRLGGCECAAVDGRAKQLQSKVSKKTNLTRPLLLYIDQHNRYKKLFVRDTTLESYNFSRPIPKVVKQPPS